MVIATENPIEEEGTFNLPGSPNGRFMMKAVMTYPKPDEETSMLAMLTRRGSDMIGPKSPRERLPFRMWIFCANRRGASMCRRRSCATPSIWWRPRAVPETSR